MVSGEYVEGVEDPKAWGYECYIMQTYSKDVWLERMIQFFSEFGRVLDTVLISNHWLRCLSMACARDRK